MRPGRLTPVGLLALLVAGCTTLPGGPSLMALPGTGKGFDQFRRDDQECRQYASSTVGGSTTGEAAADSGVKSAAVGTLVGAVAGAALGGSSGAAAGAGTGLLVGSMAGAGAADTSSYALQRRYDHGYVQCMYAKGHKVPVSGNLRSMDAPAARPASPAPAPAPAAAYYPPPPPGAYYPPPPPPAPAPR